MKDNFSAQSESYAVFRPQYPYALFECINSYVFTKKLAWDCATGNGQAAKELSKTFEAVYATDISEKQLASATTASNITYAVEAAEKTILQDGSVNLVTVAQALHWFNFDKFYAAVKRVSAADGLIAAWTYSLLSISPEIDGVVHRYHFETLKDYWDAERSYVDDGYATIPFPFKKIEHPDFEISADWTINQLEGYFNTWSAAQKFIKKNNHSPVPVLMKEIQRLWPGEETLPVRFPIHLKMGYVH